MRKSRDRPYPVEVAKTSDPDLTAAAQVYFAPGAPHWISIGSAIPSGNALAIRPAGSIVRVDACRAISHPTTPAECRHTPGECRVANGVASLRKMAELRGLLTIYRRQGFAHTFSSEAGSIAPPSRERQP